MGVCAGKVTEGDAAGHCERSEAISVEEVEVTRLLCRLRFLAMPVLIYF